MTLIRLFGEEFVVKLNRYFGNVIHLWLEQKYLQTNFDSLSFVAVRIQLQTHCDFSSLQCLLHSRFELLYMNIISIARVETPVPI